MVPILPDLYLCRDITKLHRTSLPISIISVRQAEHTNSSAGKRRSTTSAGIFSGKISSSREERFCRVWAATVVVACVLSSAACYASTSLNNRLSCSYPSSPNFSEERSKLFPPRNPDRLHELLRLLFKCRDPLLLRLKPLIVPTGDGHRLHAMCQHFHLVFMGELYNKIT